MTDNLCVDDDPDYGAEVVVNEPLPQPTDPAQVPPDQGDAGKAEA